MAVLRLAFMGSPDFAVPALAALIEAGHDIAAVYAQPPRPAGRGQREHPCPVHAAAVAQGLEVRSPANFKDPADQEAFAALELDAAVVVAYGLILPRPVLDAPRLGCLNIHASMLPRWRGAAPIQRAIMAGDQETGISIMQVAEGLDTGPVLAARSVPITGETMAEDLHDALAALGAEMIVDALNDLASGRAMATSQPEDGVTYARKLARDEGRIDWSRPAGEIERGVRALNPWPGVWFEHAGQRIKVLALADWSDDARHDAAPGTVLDDTLRIACGTGHVRPGRVQRAGKAAQSVEEFLRGYGLAAGERLD